MSKFKRTRRSGANRNSRIFTKLSPTSAVARTTFTAHRDEGTLQAAIATDSSNSSAFVISKGGTTVELNGHEARTLYRTLSRHYDSGVGADNLFW